LKFLSLLNYYGLKTPGAGLAVKGVKIILWLTADKLILPLILLGSAGIIEGL
jgi:hypothetical protein